MNVENDVTSWHHRDHNVNRSENRDGEEVPEHSENRLEGRQQKMASLSESRLRLANVVSIAMEESWISAAAQAEEGQKVAFLAGFF